MTVRSVAVRFFGRRAPDIAVDRDPAQDDAELRQAVGKARGGDWGPARDLLAAFRHDYDRRARVVAVLAGSTAADGDAAWPDVWAEVEPGNADALLLRTRSLIARDRSLQVAVRVNDEAAVLAPDDPTPWAQRLILMTLLGADRATAGRGWAELLARDPWHREGHGCRLTYLARTGAHAEMLAFAAETAATAPAGSPLRVLPLAAASEWALWQTRHGDGAGTMARALRVIREQRDDPRFQGDVRAAYTEWFEKSDRRHALWFGDLNLLAQAMHRAGQHQRAGAVFAAIGPYFDEEPWRYVGGEATFQDARRKALRS
ncbi:DUF4034 domain-containing protein [Actinoplanes sp. NPDC023714]|uniref:DUF4034 domain-containing protein n=1 Tax=Actinoplanes sp. NPDC023714 TaxID=3154322 RepID=UPI0033EB4BA4